MRYIYLFLIFTLFINRTSYGYEYIDSTHKFVGDQLFSITNRVDSFFGTKRSFYEDNGTNFRIYYSAGKLESEDFDHGINFKIKLKFPELQKKLRFRFEKTNELEQTVAQVNMDPVSIDKGENKDHFDAGVGFILKETRKWHFGIESGVRVTWPLNPFLRTRLRRNLFVNKWKVLLEQQFYYFYNSGLGESFSFDIDRMITDGLLLRQSNNQVWSDDTDQVNVNHGLSLFQRLSSKGALSYNFVSSFINRPTYHLIGHNLFMTYRHLIYKKWFYAQITQGVNFLKENSFYKKAYLGLKIEAVFGSF